MSGKEYIFVLIFLLKFLRGFCHIFGEINQQFKENEMKFRNKRSLQEGIKHDNVNNLSDDEISSALSSLSIGDLNKLNNLIATSSQDDDFGFLRDTENKKPASRKRQIRDTALKKEFMTKFRKNRSPEQRIHEELQNIRHSVEKKFRANLVRRKRESTEKDFVVDDWKDDSESVSNAEYIKMLENSFPNNEINQADNKGPHIRVKREVDSS